MKFKLYERRVVSNIKGNKPVSAAKEQPDIDEQITYVIINLSCEQYCPQPDTSKIITFCSGYSSLWKVKEGNQVTPVDIVLKSETNLAESDPGCGDTVLTVPRIGSAKVDIPISWSIYDGFPVDADGNVRQPKRASYGDDESYLRLSHFWGDNWTLYFNGSTYNLNCKNGETTIRAICMNIVSMLIERGVIQL